LLQRREPCPQVVRQHSHLPPERCQAAAITLFENAMFLRALSPVEIDKAQ